jgi:hypothetical protein
MCLVIFGLCVHWLLLLLLCVCVCLCVFVWVSLCVDLSLELFLNSISVCVYVCRVCVCVCVCTSCSSCGRDAWLDSGSGGHQRGSFSSYRDSDPQTSLRYSQLTGGLGRCCPGSGGDPIGIRFCDVLFSSILSRTHLHAHALSFTRPLSLSLSCTLAHTHSLSLSFSLSLNSGTLLSLSLSLSWNSFLAYLLFPRVPFTHTLHTSVHDCNLRGSCRVCPISEKVQIDVNIALLNLRAGNIEQAAVFANRASQNIHKKEVNPSTKRTYDVCSLASLCVCLFLRVCVCVCVCVCVLVCSFSLSCIRSRCSSLIFLVSRHSSIDRSHLCEVIISLLALCCCISRNLTNVHDFSLVLSLSLKLLRSAALLGGNLGSRVSVHQGCTRVSSSLSRGSGRR